MSRRHPLAVLTGGLALAVAVGTLAGCSSSTADAPRSSTAPPAPAPLNSTATGGANGSGALAVVPMGKLRDPLNTFWELLWRAGPDAPWQLVTPLGVADNGGLVVSSAVGSGGAERWLAGFQPSQALAFSPLATSTDRGSVWSPGLVPRPLSAVPDAVATTPVGAMAALLRRDSGAVVRSSGDPSRWSDVTDASALARSAAGRACDVSSLTALSSSANGSLAVGAACRRGGVTGVFVQSAGGWVRPVPSPGSGLSGPTRVLRLSEGPATLAALVAARHGAGQALVVVSVPSGAGAGGRASASSWRRSPPLRVPSRDRVIATGVGFEGGFVVLVGSPQGRRSVVDEPVAGAPWGAAVRAPTGTAAVVAGPGGRLDALAVASTVLTDWRFDPATRSWTKMASVRVPIEFGSSS
jgi:hypothetical protein